MAIDTRSPLTADVNTAASTRPASQHTLDSRYRIGLAYGRLIHRLRWVLLAIWVVALAVSLPFAGQLSSALRGGGFTLDGSESVHVDDLMQQRLGTPASQAILVFQSTGAVVGDAAYQQELQSVASDIRGLAHITRVQRGPASTEGRTTFLLVSYDAAEGTSSQYVPALRSHLPANPGPARIYVSGTPATYSDLSAITEGDLRGAESYSLPIALIVLLIVFGTVLAGAMPLVLAVAAVPIALAILYAIATHTWTSVFVLNVATTIGLGISIDYSLIMTRRFREELAAGRTVREAVAMTVATTGEAILFSGLTVMIGFGGLFLIGIPFMTSFALGGAVVVGIALLAALTLLPSLLGILGPRVNALRLPIVSRLTAPRAETESGARRGFWHTWAVAVMRRPIPIVLGVIALLVVAGWPIFSLNPAAYGASPLPSTTDSQRGFAVLSREFPQMAQNPIYLTVQTPDGSSMLAPANLERLDALSAWLAAQPHITGVTSLTRPPTASGEPTLTTPQLEALYTSGAYARQPALAQLVYATTNGDFSVLSATADTQIDSTAGKNLIAALRSGDTAAAHGLMVQVGGIQARSVDFTDRLYGSFPRVLAFILAATYLLLLLMFRSLLLPLKAVVVNVLSLSVSFGALVWVFQWGHLSSQLGFTSNGTIDATTPILIFCILFGLSMDYEVFLLSRVREEWLRTHNNRYAVARGLEMTGGVITSAALLFSIVTGALVFTSLLTTKELGLGMAVAVLVDATIIRSLLVPATMRLLGRLNWWLPGRRLPQEEPAPV
jgi:RND superfamily putative drug exporter